eukprot:scaffold523_cov446-Prasinococcus_capsulatus_cf.AAC.4
MHGAEGAWERRVKAHWGACLSLANAREIGGGDERERGCEQEHAEQQELETESVGSGGEAANSDGAERRRRRRQQQQQQQQQQRRRQRRRRRRRLRTWRELGCFLEGSTWRYCRGGHLASKGVAQALLRMRQCGCCPGSCAAREGTGAGDDEAGLLVAERAEIVRCWLARARQEQDAAASNALARWVCQQDKELVEQLLGFYDFAGLDALQALRCAAHPIA